MIPALRIAALSGLIACLGSLVSAQEAGQPGQPADTSNAWFPKTYEDLGKFLEGELVKTSFSFQNPNDRDVKIQRIKPGCTCAKVVLKVGDLEYRVVSDPRPHTLVRVDQIDGKEVLQEVTEIPVPGLASGEFEVSIDLRGVNGGKSAQVAIHTDDPDSPVMSVTARALAMEYFTVLPKEINLNEMTWDESREFTARIFSTMEPDFEIVGVEDQPEWITVSYEKEMNGDQANWVIKGTFGPNVDPRIGGGILKFVTNVDGRKIPLRIMALIKGPMEIRPSGFIAFGRIKQGQGASSTVEFEPTGDFDLQIEKVVFKNLTIDESMLGYEVVKEGNVVKLTLSIAPDVPRRLVRGDVEVHLNHPAAKIKELQFNGFVR